VCWYVNYTSPTNLYIFHWFPGNDTDDGAAQCVDMSIIHHQLTCTSSTGSRGMTPMMALLSVLICQLYITYSPARPRQVPGEWHWWWCCSVCWYVNYTSPTHLHVLDRFPGDDTDDGAAQCVAAQQVALHHVHTGGEKTAVSVNHTEYQTGKLVFNFHVDGAFISDLHVVKTR